MSYTLLHCFDCDYKTVANKAKKIKETGYDGVQIGPVQYCKEGEENWKLYQPYSFYIGNKLGNYEDLKEMVRVCHEEGLIVVADIVLRHLAGRENGEMEFHEKCDHGIVSNKNLVMNHNGNVWNYSDRLQLIDMNAGMPTLNYYNKELWYKCYFPLTDCLLNDIGIDGLRIDQMKHIALPDEGCDLLKELVERYPDKLIYGEAINLNELGDGYKDKYAKYCMLLISMWEFYWDFNKAMYFVESHDTYHTFGNTRYYSDEERLDKWMLLAARGANKLYFSRSKTLDENEDKTIFCERMKWINENYK